MAACKQLDLAHSLLESAGWEHATGAITFPSMMATLRSMAMACRLVGVSLHIS